MTTNEFKCGHAPCRCTVAAEDEYRSDHCREAASRGKPVEACGCGHPACDAVKQAKPEDQSDG